jgi:hypothetical protein
LRVTISKLTTTKNDEYLKQYNINLELFKAEQKAEHEAKAAGLYMTSARLSLLEKKSARRIQ